MKKTYNIVYVDDDPQYRKMMVHVLKKAGHTIHEVEDSTKAMDVIKKTQPDCVLSDLMMPKMDGTELLKRIREDQDLGSIKVIIASSKSYEYDKNRAFKLGADGYILKSIENDAFIQKFMEIMDEKIAITCWGARGTLPVSNEKVLRYGGNTACISMEFGKDNFFIFDAGTGITALSEYILKNNRPLTKAKLFISHPHWDHINAFPFFVPLFIQGNDIEVMGAAHGDVDIEGLLSHQMDGVYFPINIKEFSARVHFKNLNEETFEIDGIKMSTMLLNHPGNCLGFRIEYKGRVVCYVTDNEIYPEDCAFYEPNYIQRLTDFVRNADVLITDCCYSDEAYSKKINWGHSCPSEVCRLAHNAEVKALYLFHHDPSQDDEAIDKKLEQATHHLKALSSNTVVFASKEREVIHV